MMTIAKLLLWCNTCPGYLSDRVTNMEYSVKASRASIDVGPPEGPHHTIPRAFTITAPADTELPYDITIKTEYDPTEGRHVIIHVAFDRPAGGDRIRSAHVARYPLYDLVEAALERAVLGDKDWNHIVDLHQDDHHPHAVDGLVYLLSHALGSQKPTATVAAARGLAPGSGPKRVSAARQAGHIPAAKPGKAG